MSSMYNFQTYSLAPTNKKTPCPHCDGEGQYYTEVPVVDYQHGGFLDEVVVECEECGGSGEQDIDE